MTDNLDQQAVILADKLQSLYLEYKQVHLQSGIDVQHLSWHQMRSAYLQLLQSL